MHRHTDTWTERYRHATGVTRAVDRYAQTHRYMDREIHTFYWGE